MNLREVEKMKGMISEGTRAMMEKFKETESLAPIPSQTFEILICLGFSEGITYQQNAQNRARASVERGGL